MSGAIVNYKAAAETLSAALAKHAPEIRALLPRSMPVDRFISVVLGAAGRSPMILQCEPMSVIRVVKQGAELGLEIGGVLGEAFIVPFQNRKKGRLEAQFIGGYRGYIKLAHESPKLNHLDARLVYAADHFAVEYGTSPSIVHRYPLDGSDRGQVVRAYSIATYVSGLTQFDVMELSELDRVRKSSKAQGSSSPWNTHREEMYRKTVVRRHAKYLPLSDGLRKIQEFDSEDPAPDLAPTETSGRVQGLRDRLRAQVIDVPEDDAREEPEE